MSKWLYLGKQDNKGLIRGAEATVLVSSSVAFCPLPALPSSHSLSPLFLSRRVLIPCIACLLLKHFTLTLQETERGTKLVAPFPCLRAQETIGGEQGRAVLLFQLGYLFT